MTQIAERVKKFLDKDGVRYAVVPHERDYTAQETAHHTHTPAHAFAKAVVARAGERYVMAVVPAHHEVDLERLSEVHGHQPVELASEAEIEKLCPDCDVGAVPPFGNLYDMAVYASPLLGETGEITFVGGSHSHAIRLAWRDWERLVGPRLDEVSAVRPQGQSAQAPRRGSS